MLRSYESVVNVEPLTEATPITWETIDQEQKQFSVLAVNKTGTSFFEASNMEILYNKLQEKETVLLGKRAFDEWGGEIGQSILMNTPAGTKEFKVVDVVDTSHHAGYVAFMDEEQMNGTFGWSNHFDMLLTVKDKS